ncbi:hypothetical protein JGI3_00035 [Candidatus Kryptobacter tengchongensis]|uniref:DipZ thioredoxin-like C-terminal domain-containing protein n=2 Tax=Kryptobacter tengchongensis TaxID=1643429 RepID=A0A656D134_KRYT1|nr:hypothetical protein [Candidatus Kryptobacter tengchongensis]CUS91956.1 hypothetical protein JGI20_00333 [Candidatus Kryptobacter tengchongensis]CUT01158.1 hypothetical protein JGI22_00110 [Candidatus Kryptobacter tengchongensis]CUT02563.1 hypothetical protein JGI24_01149 [Candidatus Kryptobacter tengchongensis]CUU00702.1 hypothetical protein JGI2_00623 [Candidatus Kryptobacter tengchongensis]CUU09329.1 hypothetical protein JGI3_00035 [Candidatus Kryptobacter tengchongensis]
MQGYYKKQIVEENNRAIDIIANYWLNSEPVFFESLRGNVVLLLFFNYASGEWKEFYEYVKEWWKRYKDKGLFILGVHIPKFPFESKFENVEKEIKRLGIDFPIAIDNEWINLKRYTTAVRGIYPEVPLIFLINRDGLISYSHFGVRNLWEVEFFIQSLLIKAGYYGDFPLPIGSRYEIDESTFYRIIPEIYTCYTGGALGNVEGFAPESVIKYEDPGIYINGKFYLDGEWYNGRYYLRYNPTSGGLGSVILPYAGTRVGAVMESLSKGSLKVLILQDGEFINERNRGEDVIVENGQSYIKVCEPRYYEIVRNPDFGEHILRLYVDSESFTIYKFSISAYSVRWELIKEI